MSKASPLDSGTCCSLIFWRWLTSFLYFNWRHRTSSNPLLISDVWSVPKDTESIPLAEQFQQHWRAMNSPTTKQQGGSRLTSLLIHFFWKRWLLAGLSYICWCVCALLQPEIVAWTASYLSHDNATATATPLFNNDNAWTLPLLLFVCGIGYAWSINIKFHILSRLGVQAKAMIQSVLIGKALRLHVNTQTSGIGAWTNLVSNDTEQIAQAMMFLHYLWLSVGFVLVVVVLMVLTVGVAALLGFGILLLLLPLNGMVSSWIGSRKSQMLKETDQRTNLVAQMLQGIEVIKSWGMESAFEERIGCVRSKEMVHLSIIHYMRIFLKTALFAVPTLVAVVTLHVARVWFHHPLNLVICLKTLSYLNILRFPLLLIPYALSLLFEARASIARIETFLDLPECPVEQDGSLDSGRGIGDDEKQQIVLDNASLSWSTLSSSPDILSDISFCANEGELVGVVGPVGCGKTLLLHGLLNELEQTNTAIRVHRHSQKISYFSQTPQIFNNTIRENIVFDETYDEERYQQVLHASCLDIDIQNMLQGDQTNLGERGINLSGGQKARVAFARCLYSATSMLATQPTTSTTHHTAPSCPLVLLDDPLSAVDVEVGRKMWHRGVVGILNRMTVVVVMSSRVDELLLPSADKIVTLTSAGTINVAERPNQMLPSSDRKEKEGKDKADDLVETIDTIETETQGTFSVQNLHTDKQTKKEQRRRPNLANDKDDLDIIVKEQRNTGKVRCYIWGWFLALACSTRQRVQPVQHGSSLIGGILACLLIVVFSTAQASKSFIDISLLWYGSIPTTPLATPLTNMTNLVNSTNLPSQYRPSFFQTWDEEVIQNPYAASSWTLFLYLFLVTMWLLSLFRSCFMIQLFLRSARQLHAVVLSRLLRGPLVWFQRRPHGRILNKFSSDIMKADLLLPDQAQSLLENVSGLFAAFALSVISVPWLTLVLIPAIVALCVVVNLFRATSREVVRLDGEARSPVYSSFGDALNARVTLRAFNMQKHVRTRTCHQIDVANSVNLLHKMLDRWNSMRLNAIMTLYAACLYFAAVTIKRQSNLQIASGDDSGAANGGLFDSSVIGLALVYSLQLMGLSSWTAMTFVQTENALTSVERLHQLMSMPQEKEDIKTTDPVVSPKRTTTNEDGTTHEDGTKHKDGTTHEDSTTNTDSVDQKLDIIWPTKGRLVLKNVNLRYRANLPLALNGLNLDVVGGERVGIVGRTGVGKSSVFASVLRLTEPTADSSIALDGIELTSVGLRLIRRDLITLIPQNPVVFSGTIKFNLDPYQEHDIEQLWSMLNDLRMKTTVEARGGLMSDCGKNGSLLSHGQRQLLVVGRALLQNKRTRVYLLDEATSSMDDETDDIVQLAIQKYAQGITTIIVAHRLATVLHCDRIAVMDQGQVIQIGSPKDIAHEVGSPFATMMEKSGIPKDEWPKRSK